MNLFVLLILRFFFNIVNAKECNVLLSAASTHAKVKRSWIHLNSTCQVWLTPKENQLIELTLHHLHASADSECQTTCTDQKCSCDFGRSKKDNYIVIRSIQSELLCFCGSFQNYPPFVIKTTEMVSVTYTNIMSKKNKTYATLSFTFQTDECGQRHITQSPGIIFSREENATDVMKTYFHFVKCTWIIHGYRENLIALNLVATTDGNCSSLNITVTPVNDSHVIHSFCSGDGRQEIIIPKRHEAASVREGLFIAVAFSIIIID